MQQVEGVRSIATMRATFGMALMSTILLQSEWTFSAELRPAWQVEWQKTVEAAKKEGQVNIYIHATQEAVLRAGVFQRTYPEIEISAVPARLGSNEQRILAERRAGKFLADVMIGGADSFRYERDLDTIKSALILPDVVDESKWWSGKHLYEDSEGRYVFRYAANLQSGSISYSTSLVDPREFKSFWDFLHPKWKGRIGAADVRTVSAGRGAMRLLYYKPKIGPEFIRKLLGEMDITLFRDLRQGVDWMANRKFALCFFCLSEDVARAKRQGLPVDNFPIMKEGAGFSSTHHKIFLLNKAPHPNAARVFANWFLSREGQITLQKATIDVTGWSTDDSFRIDIPKDHVAPHIRRVEGIEYTDLSSPELRGDFGTVLKLVQETLAKVGK